ncbi:MAG: hypothetical protein LBL52_01655 [Rickettsiales bacterium]|nr:hypothetical protein [Rickettsiales bacterium]
MRKLFIFLLLAGLPVFAGETLRYVAPPYLAAVAKSAMEKIFDGTDASVRSVPADSYNSALQSAMIYDPKGNTNVDIFFGATFDEKVLDRLDFIPVPAGRDFLCIAVEGARRKAASPDEMAFALAKTMRPLALIGVKLPLDAGAAGVARVDEAMVEVAEKRAFLVAPCGAIEDFLARAKGRADLKTVQAYRFKKAEILYFVAISRYAEAKQVSLDGKSYSLMDFMAEKLQLR